MNQFSGWSRSAWRGAVQLAPELKWVGLLALIALVALAELVTGAFSLAFLHVFFVGMAVCLIDLPAGLAAAALCSVVGVAVDSEIGMPLAYGSGLLTLAPRFALFAVVALGTAVFRATEVRLQREITVCIRQLRVESLRRLRVEAEILQAPRGTQAMLAQQIHDDLGQHISALSFHAKLLAEDLHGVMSVHAGRADRIVEVVRVTNEVVRRLSRDEPEVLSGELVGALSELAADVERLSGVKCELRTTVTSVTLDRFRALMLGRIVREACSNAVKHGNPKVISILLSMRASTLRVEIDDDGCGFAVAADQGVGIGLQIMRRRAGMIGATLRIRSAGAGCTLTCELPLRE